MAITLQNSSYYVYLLLDPTNFYVPFYVGKGKSNRAQSHLSKKRSDNVYLMNKIAAIREKGHEPTIMKWAENLQETEAYTLETELITRFGRKYYDLNGILTNVCVDNRPPSRHGYVMPEETKQKISASNKGRKWSDDARQKASVARRGKKRGRPSPDTIEKIRLAQVGKERRKWSEEEKQKARERRAIFLANQSEYDKTVFSQTIRENWEKRIERYGPSGRSGKKTK